MRRRTPTNPANVAVAVTFAMLVLSAGSFRVIGGLVGGLFRHWLRSKVSLQHLLLAAARRDLYDQWFCQ